MMTSQPHSQPQGLPTAMASPLSLSRQSSIYSLTLNEVQSYLGDQPLHTMNLDDLLRNVIPDSADSSSPSPIHLRLDRPPPATLSKKTVDEVWRDIQTSVHRQSSLGEMTLEDFLSKAGVVGAAYAPSLQQAPYVANAYLGRPLPRPAGASAGSTVLDGVYREGGSGVTGAVSPVTPARKRSMATIEDVQEKTVERRQKRMIKNRESAARSRARKQAYTNELENKIARLEEEIARLTEEKKLIQDAQYVPQPEPKNPLRRMNSCNF